MYSPDNVRDAACDMNSCDASHDAFRYVWREIDRQATLLVAGKIPLDIIAESLLREISGLKSLQVCSPARSPKRRIPGGGYSPTRSSYCKEDLLCLSPSRSGRISALTEQNFSEAGDLQSQLEAQERALRDRDFDLHEANLRLAEERGRRAALGSQLHEPQSYQMGSRPFAEAKHGVSDDNSTQQGESSDMEALESESEEDIAGYEATSVPASQDESLCWVVRAEASAAEKEAKKACERLGELRAALANSVQRTEELQEEREAVSKELKVVEAANRGLAREGAECEHRLAATVRDLDGLTRCLDGLALCAGKRTGQQSNQILSQAVYQGIPDTAAISALHAEVDALRRAATRPGNGISGAQGAGVRNGAMARQSPIFGGNVGVAAVEAEAERLRRHSASPSRRLSSSPSRRLSARWPAERRGGRSQSPTQSPSPPRLSLPSAHGGSPSRRRMSTTAAPNSAIADADVAVQHHVAAIRSSEEISSDGLGPRLDRLALKLDSIAAEIMPGLDASGDAAAAGHAAGTAVEDPADAPNGEKEARTTGRADSSCPSAGSRVAVVPCPSVATAACAAAAAAAPAALASATASSTVSAASACATFPGPGHLGHLVVQAAARVGDLIGEPESQSTLSDAKFCGCSAKKSSLAVPASFEAASPGCQALQTVRSTAPAQIRPASGFSSPQQRRGVAKANHDSTALHRKHTPLKRSGSSASTTAATPHNGSRDISQDARTAQGASLVPRLSRGGATPPRKASTATQPAVPGAPVAGPSASTHRRVSAYGVPSARRSAAFASPARSPVRAPGRVPPCAERAERATATAVPPARGKALPAAR